MFWALFKKKKGAIIRFASINDIGEINVDEFKKHITKKLKWLLLHIFQMSGTIMPVKKIIDLAKSKIFLC